MAMTAKMIKFCQEYCVDGHITKAAIRAGYSEDTAYSTGSENMKKPEIQKYIEELQADAVKAAKITREKIALTLANVAFVDVRKFYTPESKLKDVKKIDKETATALVGIDVDELWERGEEGMEQTGVTKKIKLASRLQAIDMLNKMGGFYAPEKVAQTDGAGNDVKPTFVIQEYRPESPIVENEEGE